MPPDQTRDLFLLLAGALCLPSLRAAWALARRLRAWRARRRLARLLEAVEERRAREVSRVIREEPHRIIPPRGGTAVVRLGEGGRRPPRPYEDPGEA
jgi:hypothetical protein